MRLFSPGLAFLLVTVGAAGCGSKPPTASLVSWRTTRDPLPVLQGQLPLKSDSDVYVIARVRATGTGLYRKSETDKTMYDLQLDRFTLAAPDGPTGRVVGQRDPASKPFGGNTYRDKPGAEEEVEVAFVADAKLAERADLVLRYADLPALTLDPTKKVK